MTTYGFEVTCKKNLIDIIKDKYGEEYELSDMHLISLQKTLKNIHAIIVDCGPNERVYDCVLNGERNEITFDLYEKTHRVVMDSRPRYIKE